LERRKRLPATHPRCAVDIHDAPLAAADQQLWRTPDVPAALSTDGTKRAINRGLRELEDKEFVPVDARRCELLVRTYIRHDRIGTQPNLVKSARKQVHEIESTKIREYLVATYPWLTDETLSPNQSGGEPLSEGVAEAQAPSRFSSPTPSPSPTPTTTTTPSSGTEARSEARGAVDADAPEKTTAGDGRVIEDQHLERRAQLTSSAPSSRSAGSATPTRRSCSPRSRTTSSRKPGSLGTHGLNRRGRNSTRYWRASG
jgi:hypothetical protein